MYNVVCEMLKRQLKFAVQEGHFELIERPGPYWLDIDWHAIYAVAVSM